MTSLDARLTIWMMRCPVFASRRYVSSRSSSSDEDLFNRWTAETICRSDGLLPGEFAGAFDGTLKSTALNGLISIVNTRSLLARLEPLQHFTSAESTPHSTNSGENRVSLPDRQFSIPGLVH